MRVLFVNENIGGHETVHQNLEPALADHPEIEAEFLHAPRPRLPRRLVGATVPGLGRLDLDLQALRAQLALSAVLRHRLRPMIEGFDCVHVYTQNAALLSVELLRSVPTVVSLDSTNAQNAFQLPQRQPTRFTPRLLPITQWFERRVFRAATLLAPSSGWCAESLRSGYSVPIEKIRTLPFGVPVVDPLPPAPRTSGLPEITFVGRDLERKGGNRLIELHQRFLVDRCVLNLVTRDEVVARPNVRVHNDVRPGDGKLGPLLRGSRAFVFPSEIDKSPNSVLEAMADAVPVVALRVNGLPDMVDDGVTGFLLEPGDDGALVDAVMTLIDDPDRAARMGAAGHQRAVDRFDIAVTTAHLVDVLDDACRRWVPDGSA